VKLQYVFTANVARKYNPVFNNRNMQVSWLMYQRFGYPSQGKASMDRFSGVYQNYSLTVAGPHRFLTDFPLGFPEKERTYRYILMLHAL